MCKLTMCLLLHFMVVYLFVKIVVCYDKHSDIVFVLVFSIIFTICGDMIVHCLLHFMVVYLFVQTVVLYDKHSDFGIILGFGIIVSILQAEIQLFNLFPMVSDLEYGNYLLLSVIASGIIWFSSKTKTKHELYFAMMMLYTYLWLFSYADLIPIFFWNFIQCGLYVELIFPKSKDKPRTQSIKKATGIGILVVSKMLWILWMCINWNWIAVFCEICYLVLVLISTHYFNWNVRDTDLYVVWMIIMQNILLVACGYAYSG
eukprot:535691_1